MQDSALADMSGRKILLIGNTAHTFVVSTKAEIDYLPTDRHIDADYLGNYTDLWLGYDSNTHGSYLIAVRQRLKKGPLNLVVLQRPGATAQLRGVAKARLRKSTFPCCLFGNFACTSNVRVYHTWNMNLGGKCSHAAQDRKVESSVHEDTPLLQLLLKHYLVNNVATPGTAPVGRDQGAQRVPDQAGYNENVKAFPTDAAERKRNAKRAAKAEGREWTVTPRKKVVEDHYDDCGEDMSAIEDFPCYQVRTDEVVMEPETDSDSGQDDQPWPDCGIEQFAFFGPRMAGIPNVSGNVELFPHAESLFAYLATLGPQSETQDRMVESGGSPTSMMELCSCDDGTGRIAMRVSHASGRTDALADVQFHELATQNCIAAYYAEKDQRRGPPQRPQRHNAARRTAASCHREPKRDQRRAKGREPKDQSRKPHQYFLRGSMSALSFPKLPGDVKD